MIGLIRNEWMKLFSKVSTYIFIGFMILGIIGAGFISNFMNNSTEGDVKEAKQTLADSNASEDDKLMAADILLFQADVVPVGKDQMQHLEITRDIANRFNNIYGDVFTIPEPYIGKAGAKIMSLQEPDKKMSKSDENTNASIYLMDDPDTIMRKCKRAVTDSGSEVLYREDKPGVSNLIDIYRCCLNKSVEEVEREFDGKGYGDFKMAVGEAVVSVLKPLQDEFNRLSKDKAYIDGIIKENAEKANYYATKTLRKVQKKVGFPERVR